MVKPLECIVRVAGRRRRIHLDATTWEALQDVSGRKGHSIHDVVTEIYYERECWNLPAAIRCYLVGYYRELARTALENSRKRIGRLIAECIERNGRDDPALTRKILETIEEAGYGVTRWRDLSEYDIRNTD